MHYSKVITQTRKKLLRGMGLALFSVLAAQAPAQAADPGDSGWTLIQKVNEVAFYYQVANCNGHPMLLLRVVNGGSQRMAGHWRLEIETGTGKLQFPGVLMPLESGAERAATCNRPEPNLLIPVPVKDPASLQLSVAATLNSVQ